MIVIMKLLKYALLILVLGLFNLNANAQNDQSVSAHAHVYSQITYNTVTNVDFAGVQAISTAPTLDPKNTGNNQNVGASATTGKLAINAETNQTINITFPTSVLLTGPGTDITYSLDVYGNTTDVASGSSSISSGANPTTASSADGNNNVYYIYIGGDLGDLSGQTVGDYNGSVTFSIAYP